MSDSSALEGKPYLLIVKLCRMDSNDSDRLIPVSCLQSCQRGQYVHAVDATIGPEVVDQDPPMQLSAM